MKKAPFKVIKGGLTGLPAEKRHEFISSHVTDTRLMGVVSMYVHWYYPEDDYDIHQFFYFDTEEFGFESYRSVIGNDEFGIRIMEAKVSGGLGGEQVEITERQALALFNEYAAFNKAKGIPMPPGEDEYSFMLKEAVELSEEEKRELFAKQCCPIVGNYQALNYFLMRGFGHDYEACRYLSTASVDPHMFDKFNMSTFYKNTIDMTENPYIYMCESVIEDSHQFRIVTTEITLHAHKVMEAKIISSFKITPAEFTMIMTRPEYVTVYDITTEPETVDEIMRHAVLGSTSQEHVAGVCYTVYNRTNDHVKRKVFWLNEDVYGVYFVSANGQLVIAAYHEEFIEQMEIEVAVSELGEHVRMGARYEFKDPVLYEYIQGDFGTFEDFLELLTGQDFFEPEDDE